MRSIPARTPVIVAACLIALINIALSAQHLAHAQPNNPWEAGHVVDGWRFSQGLPVYEDPHGARHDHVWAAGFDHAGRNLQTYRCEQLHRSHPANYLRP